MIRIMTQREYKAETVRTSLVGDKVDAGDIEKLLNDRAREGWTLRTITATTVKGRIGPGGSEGLLVVFEREV
jgi:hypothetical protein